MRLLIEVVWRTRWWHLVIVLELKQEKVNTHMDYIDYINSQKLKCLDLLKVISMQVKSFFAKWSQFRRKSSYNLVSNTESLIWQQKNLELLHSVSLTSKHGCHPNVHLEKYAAPQTAQVTKVDDLTLTILINIIKRSSFTRSTVQLSQYHV